MKWDHCDHSMKVYENYGYPMLSMVYITVHLHQRSVRIDMSNLPKLSPKFQVVTGLLHSIGKLLGRQIDDLPGPLGDLGRFSGLSDFGGG